MSNEAYKAPLAPFLICIFILGRHVEFSETPLEDLRPAEEIDWGKDVGAEISCHK